MKKRADRVEHDGHRSWLDAVMWSSFALLLALYLLVAWEASSWAADIPRVGPADPGVRTAVYNEWQVYELHGAYRAAMVVEFAVGEKIENIGVGDTTAWDTVDAGNVLFLKPRAHAPPTNAIVQTRTKDNKERLYQFTLTATETTNPAMMKIKFVYPGDVAEERRQVLAKQAEQEASERAAGEALSAIYSGPRNWAYTVAGTAAFVPNEVWDNGRATAFSFPGQTELPAIYAVSGEDEERLAPSHTQDGLVVVHEVAAKWRLRSGGQVICIYNEDFKPGWGPDRGNGSATSSWWRRILGD
jgi:type IV secretion system protein VirB9